MRYCKVGLLLIMLGLSLSAGAGEAKIAVSTLGIDFELAPGETLIDSFVVQNTGDTTQEVSVNPQDFARSVTGENQFAPPGTFPRSLAPYVTVSPATFRLEPDQVQEVQFRVELPEDAPGPHWMILLVRESDPEVVSEAPPGGVGFSASVTFGVQLRQTDPTNAVADGRVTRIQVIPPEGENPLAVELVFENTGTTFLEPRGRVEIRDAGGATVANLPIESFRVFPGASRQVRVALAEPLEPGRYVALGIVDFGGEFLVAGQAAFEINVP